MCLAQGPQRSDAGILNRWKCDYEHLYDDVSPDTFDADHLQRIKGKLQAPDAPDFPMGDSSQFSPLTTLSEQLGPNSWVSSVFIPAFIANIGKHFFLKYFSEYSKSI